MDSLLVAAISYNLHMYNISVIAMHFLVMSPCLHDFIVTSLYHFAKCTNVYVNLSYCEINSKYTVTPLFSLTGGHDTLYY